MADRYVLCRPLGGLNDALCQVEVCWNYAERTNRALILDFGQSTLLKEFFNLLEPIQDRARIYLNPSISFIESLESLTVFPSEIQSKLGNYEAVSLAGRDPNLRFDSISKVELSFDLSRDYPEDVLVHHRQGGGRASFRAIARFRLKREAEKLVLEGLRDLPSSYKAAHIRATDYQTDFEGFLRRLVKVERTGPVLVCSDSNLVLDRVRRLKTKVAFFTFPDFEGVGVAPLHLERRGTNRSEYKDLALRLLLELYALGKADEFFFTFLDTPKAWSRPQISGFTSLAAHIVGNRGSIPIWRDNSAISGSFLSRGTVKILAPTGKVFLYYSRQQVQRVARKVRKIRRRVRIRWAA